MENLKNAVNQFDLIDIYRTLHLTTVECMFFSHTHDTFTKVDCILDYKTNVNKFKRREIMRSMFSDHKLNLKSVTERYLKNHPNIYKLNNLSSP